MSYEILMERHAIVKAFRQYMGPGHEDSTDKNLCELAGWEAFYEGWKAGIDHSLPIKKEPLSKRTTHG
jgi:hypothetical protein